MLVFALSEWSGRYFAQLVTLAGEHTVNHLNFFTEDAIEFRITNEFIADDDLMVFFFLCFEAILLYIFATKALHASSD